MNQYIAIQKTVADMEKEVKQFKEYLITAKKYISMAEDISKSSSRYTINCRVKNGIDQDIKEIDGKYWQAAFNLTNLSDFMDHQEMKNITNSFYDHTCPVFTEANVRDTFLAAYAKAGDLFERGLVKFFQMATNNYRTNDGFKVGKKLILDYMCEADWNGKVKLNYAQEGKLNDLDRVVRKLNNDTFTAHALESEIKNNLKNGVTSFEIEYFKIKCFKKGTMHVEIKNVSLISKINKIISNYYGVTLAKAA